MNILEKMEAIDFSDTEKERIGKSLLVETSLQSRVLLTKAVTIRDHSFWHDAHKTFRVTGFRAGHPKGIQMVLTRALDAQRNHVGRQPLAGWYFLKPLYLRSVMLYVHDDMAGLHSLLKREDFDEGPGTLTEQILRSIAKRLPLYEATEEQVRELYELWGFERTQYVDSILTQISLDAHHVRRMLADGIGMVRRELVSALGGLKADVSSQADLEARELVALKRSIQVVRDELDGAVARIEKVSTALTSRAGHSNIVKSSEKADGRVSASDSRKPVNDRLLTSIDSLQGRVEGLGRQVKELRSKVDVLAPSGIESAAQRATQPQTVTQAQVLNKWLSVFPDVGMPRASRGASWIMLQIIRRSRIILTDKPKLFTGLANALPGAEVRHVAPSPLWTSGSDWKDALAFIAQDDGVPRVLLVMDFEVALQEAYLVPSLTAWVASMPARSTNRIVLVPSGADLTEVSPRVFELATVLTHDAPYVSELKRLGDMVNAAIVVDVPETAASIVGYTESVSIEAEDHLRRIMANCGVSVPARTLENFVTLYGGLRGALGSRDAGIIAQQAVLLPWMEHARGETVCRAVSAALKVVLDVE